VEIVKLEVPTVFGKSVATVAAAMAEVKPDAVLCIGQAGGRYDLTPERVAINLDDARIQDNEGNQPIDVPVFEDGAPAYFSNLPIKAMVAKIREVGLPASVSNTAGTFVCNHLMYGVLYHIAKSYPGVKGGFMHVPFVPSQTVNRPTPAPSMCEQDIARGIEAAIAAIAENEVDIKAAEGLTH
jgi:pyroglutamyl-peptidase